MGALQNAFEKGEVLKDASFLGRLFSSPLIRGSYKEEAPLVDIQIEGDKNEKLRLTSLVNTIAKNSPTGREILETAAKAGYKLSFERQSGSYGLCNPKEKRLCLNPMIQDKRLIPTLVHESRHAQQYLQGFERRFCAYDVATEVKLRRALEADAQAAATQSMLEIRASTKKNDLWNKFENDESHITDNIKIPRLSDSLESIVEKRDETMQNAFRGWFKNRSNVSSYESSYLYSRMEKTLSVPDEETKKEIFDYLTFEGSMSSEKILKMVCTTGKGKCYFANDLNALDNEEMCGITYETQAAAKDFFKERKKLTGKPEDNSVESLPKRGSIYLTAGLGNSMFSLKPVKQEKKSAPSALLMTALKNRSR